MKWKQTLVLSLMASVFAITAYTDTASARRHARGETSGSRDPYDGEYTYQSPDPLTAVTDALGGVYGYQWKRGRCWELRTYGPPTVIRDRDEARRSCPERGAMKFVDHAYCKSRWKAVRAEMFSEGELDIPNFEQFKPYCGIYEDSDATHRRYKKKYVAYNKKRHGKSVKKVHRSRSRCKSYDEDGRCVDGLVVDDADDDYFEN